MNMEEILNKQKPKKRTIKAREKKPPNGTPVCLVNSLFKYVVLARTTGERHIMRADAKEGIAAFCEHGWRLTDEKPKCPCRKCWSTKQSD